MSHHLTYADTKSHKFWSIKLEGCTHTVNFGRVGTDGQNQTKEFATEAEARQSYEKLLREKLKKGYVEAPQVSEEARQKESSREKVVTATQSVIPKLQSPPLIALNPEDWFWATWRSRIPLLRPEAVPFSLDDAQARLTKVTTGNYGWQWDWSRAEIAVSLCREEAHFWLMAMMQANGQIKPKQLAEQLATQIFTGNVSFDTIKDTLVASSNALRTVARLSPEICLPLVNLFPLTNLLELLFFMEMHTSTTSNQVGWEFQALLTSLLQGFHQYVLPYLKETEIEELRQLVQSKLDLGKWPTADYYKIPSTIFHVAAYLGCRNLRTLVESWTDDYYSGAWHDHYHRPQEIIFGLDDPQFVESQMRRLKLRLRTPVHVRAWLAHTEYSALDYVRDSILNITNKDEAASLLATLALVKAPQAAPLMMELMLSSKVPQIARQWLQENPEQAIAGLIAVATRRGRLAEATIELLRGMKRKGYAEFIQTRLEQEAADTAAKVRLVLEDEETYLPFNGDTPAWLQAEIAPLQTLAQVPKWIAPLDLPPVVVGEYRLHDAQVEALLIALKQSSLDNPHALVMALKANADRQSLDAFAWKLFESWLVEGAPAKENWAMKAVGLLGADTAALKLAPLLRVWPGESQHQRAVLGLECLRTIGSDTALMQINGIAQKVKFKGLKVKAQECMEAIAQSRNMSREQLEDRIVPDCDLNEHGSRIFAFGSRQFRFVLGANLKPQLLDEAGKIKSDLPKPGAKDDQELAQAISDWKLLKKQISEAVKIQSLRLEQAMVMERRWQSEEFETLMVLHPLMTNLARLLVWGSYTSPDELVATFRITEDQTLADENDDVFVLKGIQQVGIVHPLHLTQELRSTWGELLSDYEIVPPFPQLGRPIYTLEPAEVTVEEITRFQNIQIPIVALVRTLENLGWLKGVLHDHGDYSLHYKYFPTANVTAVVGDYQEVFVDLSVQIGSGQEAIDGCCFLHGLHTNLYDYPCRAARSQAQWQLIPLGQIDPVTISEVLHDLNTVAAKGQ